MRLGVLFSGGKDSTYALYKAMDTGEVVCLITLASKNPESYMFHTPNIHVTVLQAEALGLPSVKKSTEGVREEELADLSEAVLEARQKYGIEGVVTGAVASTYQAKRVQCICDRLSLRCINPLWGREQLGLLSEIIGCGFEVAITAVAAYPFDDSWLGRVIDEETVDKLGVLQDKYRINPAGEGGEIETTVLDAPIFSKRVTIMEAEKTGGGNAWKYNIKKAVLEDK